MQHGRKHFSTLIECLLPFLPSSQFLLFTPLPAFLSYAGAQLGVNLGESASPGDIHLVSISKLPPLVPLIKLLTFPAFSGLQYLYFPLASLQLLAFILFQYLNFPQCPPQQLPAFIWFQMWHPRGLPAISFKPLVSIF